MRYGSPSGHGSSGEYGSLLGQNRSRADIDGAIDGLRAGDSEQLAGATADARRDL